MMNRHLSRRVARASAAMAILTLACTSALHAGDLLTNGNLNLDADANNMPDAWSNWSYGDTAFTAYKNDPANDPFDFNGTPYVNAGNYGDWWSSGGGWFQVVPGALANTPYTFQAWCSTEGWDNAAGELRIIYQDAGNTVIRQDVLHSAEYIANQPWTRFSLTTTSPENTAFVKVEFATWGARGAVLWDEASLLQAHVWNVDSGGDFATGGNWLGGVPTEAGAVAQFAGAITAPHTVAIDSPATLGGIRFDNAFAYTLAGAATLTLQDASGVVNVDVYLGNHTINLPLVVASDTKLNVAAGSTLSISDPVVVSAGKSLAPTGNGAVAYDSTVSLESGAAITFANSSHLSALTMADASRATLTTGPGKALKIDALSVNATATLDLNDNVLVTGASKASVTARVAAARNGGAWDQPGITSSTAAANTGRTTGLGILSGAELNSVGGTGTLNGQPYAATDTVVKYTWNGDANLDGRVTFDDYVKIDTGFNTQLTGWLNGDFNYSGNVSFDDYVLIDIAFNQQNGTLAHAIDWISGDDRSGSGRTAAGVSEVIDHLDQFGSAYGAAFLAAVPEPASMTVVALLFGAMLGRRRRAG